MASITMESSYQSTNKDMGTNHIKAHAHQHKYLLSDEPKIETLTNNRLNDQSTDLALHFAQENLGLLKPDEWITYNNRLRKSRQKDSYLEYILAKSANFTKAKQRRLKNPKTAKKTREKIARELHSIIDNAGIPIDGSLYYISNTEMYDKMTEQQLSNYRKFEATTLKRFYNSNIFQSLNPENIRAEIHFDENGAIHLQTQNIWFHRDKRGRLTYAKRAIIGNKLAKWYGNEEELQHHLDILCEFEEIANKKGKKIGTKRADTMFNEYIKSFPWGRVNSDEKKNMDGSTRKFKFSKAERNTRLEELWRIEQMNELGKIATETAKEFGINYTVNRNYSTDGVHLDGAAYIAHKKARQKTSKDIAKGKQVQKVAEAVSNNIRSTFKELSGQDTPSKEPLSLTAKKIKTLNNSTKKEVNDNQLLIQKQQALINQQAQKISDQQRQLQTIKQQKDKLKADNEALKAENSRLKQVIETLRKRAKSAGLIIGHWVRKHWDELQKPLHEYATNIKFAENERLHGGPTDTGDTFYAHKYEKKANDGILSSIDAIEAREWAKSGLNNIIQDTTTAPKQTQAEDDLSR